MLFRRLMLVLVAAAPGHCGAALAASESSSVEARSEFDVAIKVGNYSGKILKPAEKPGTCRLSTDPEACDVNFRYGGASGYVVLHRNFTHAATVMFQIGVVTDFENNQVSRQSYDAGIAYHILGGSKVMADDAKFASRIWRSSYNLSLVTFGGLHHYSASEKNLPADRPRLKVSGAALEAMVGVQYRQDIGQAHSIGIEALTTALSFPASADRLDQSGSEVTLFWRFLM